MEPAGLQADERGLKPADKPSLTLHRKFPVAPEKVWRAWAEPEALRQWFDPAARDGHERGWTVTFGKLEAFLGKA